MSDTERVRSLCRDEGFPLVAIARAEPDLGARAGAIEALAKGQLADMRWMDERWITRATDPGTFLGGGRSLIVLGLPNHSPEPADEAGGITRGVVARYARGRDYHRVFESKLRRITRVLRENFQAGARATVDYGPLLERPYAAAAGLGWQGKSTMLLAPGFGPWVMLGVIATTLELEPDLPLKKTCGSCTRCIVACPTRAISPEGHVLDSRLCISYHTIENRGPIPRELRRQFGARIFGCDDCLDACPVGAKRWESHPDFHSPSSERPFPSLTGLLALDEAAFAERFRGTAIMRAKRDGMARNACIALGNVGAADDLPALVEALGDTAALVRGHAAWAIGELGRRLNMPVSWPLSSRLQVEHDPWVRDELNSALRGT
ncbi:MAG TPA: tRNA epoxyqueuosine(34) reductase QueG [Tepidiformaceae bacterium]|nr:tRNA epoxyqueuosine(34) reductase QueG [Tepidiformaceae bacterium]